MRCTDPQSQRQAVATEHSRECESHRPRPMQTPMALQCESHRPRPMQTPRALQCESHRPRPMQTPRALQCESHRPRPMQTDCSLRDDSAVREPETKVHVEAAGTALRELQTNINTTLTRTHYAAAAVCLAPRPAAAAAGRCPRNECCPLTHCGVACLHTPPNNPVGTYQVLAENMDCALFLCMTPFTPNSAEETGSCSQSG